MSLKERFKTGFNAHPIRNRTGVFAASLTGLTGSVEALSGSLENAYYLDGLSVLILGIIAADSLAEGKEKIKRRRKDK